MRTEELRGARRAWGFRLSGADASSSTNARNAGWSCRGRSSGSVRSHGRSNHPSERARSQGSRGGLEIDEARLGCGEAEPELSETAFEGCRHGLSGQAFELRRGFGGKFAAAGHVAGGGVGGGQPGVDPDQKARAADGDTRLADDAAGAAVVGERRHSRSGSEVRCRRGRRR